MCTVLWKWSRYCHSSSVTCSNHLVRLQSCEKAMGWCIAQFFAKTIMKESSNFELACLKKKKKKKKTFLPSGSFLVRYFRDAFCTTISLQKRICYFDNCLSHQNCNCWHGFMGWYYRIVPCDSQLWGIQCTWSSYRNNWMLLGLGVYLDLR